MNPSMSVADHPRRLAAALGALALLLAAGAVQSEELPRYALELESGVFVPVERDFASAVSALEARRELGSAHMIVQMREVPSPAARADLAERGVSLFGYLPNLAYYARVSTALTVTELDEMGVRWAAPLALDQKLSPRLRAGEYGSWASYPGGLEIVAVQFHGDVAADRASSLLAPYGVQGDWIASISTRVLAVDPARIEEVASLDEVKYVAPLPPPMSAVNDGIRQSLSVNTLQAAPYNLSGQGSNVMIYDVGLVDKNHADFSTNRVTYGESGSPAQHSTHCGGTVGGNGQNSGGTYKGMAPSTKITSYYYEACSPNCLYNSPQDIEANYGEGMSSFGVQLSSNSLGSNIAPNGYPCSWEGDYELTAQLLDAIAHGSLGAPFLSVWAAGNERAYGNCGTSYRTTGIPATAKDNIVVGATNSNDHSMTYFSSWGPVDDGRIRPDISAPGCQNGGDGGITSTIPGGGYTSMCGTSMATPATAGVIALLRQQMRQIPGSPVSPLPSMVKALLIETAQDYGNAGPDFQFGYGEIRPVALMDHIRNRRLSRQGEISQGEETIISLDVPSGLTSLIATLAWDDPYGEILAQKELVNDLDLVLESPTGALTQPWILNPASPSSAATRGADHLNNVEQCLVSSPAAGTWKIHISGYQVPQGPQTYSIVANADPAPSLGVHQTTPATVQQVGGWPNPMADRATLSFSLAVAGRTSIEIFDAGGRRVRSVSNDQWREAGLHFVPWDGRDDRGAALPAGAYFYRVQADGTAAFQKIVIVK